MSPERKAKFKALVKRLKAMTEEERIDLILSAGITTVDGHKLSGKNMGLILLQAGSIVPTVVGGYRQWQKAGRQVKKGEHGFMIWFPSQYKKESDDGEEEEETRFLTGTVFDVSQTEEQPEH